MKRLAHNNHKTFNCLTRSMGQKYYMLTCTVQSAKWPVRYKSRRWAGSFFTDKYVVLSQNQCQTWLHTAMYCEWMQGLSQFSCMKHAVLLTKLHTYSSIHISHRLYVTSRYVAMGEFGVISTSVKQSTAKTQDFGRFSRICFHGHYSTHILTVQDSNWDDSFQWLKMQQNVTLWKLHHVRHKKLNSCRLINSKRPLCFHLSTMKSTNHKATFTKSLLKKLMHI